MAVDLTLAKAQCRVTGNSEDALITQYLNAAKAWVENFTSKKLANATVSQQFAGFRDPLHLMWGPTPSEAVVAYLDGDGDAQTITDATLAGNNLFPPTGESWPSPLENTAITVTYKAGYATTPPDLDQAVLLLIGEYYDNRTAGEASPAVIAAVTSLCDPYRSVMV